MVNIVQPKFSLIKKAFFSFKKTVSIKYTMSQFPAGHPSLSRWKDLCPESWSQEDVLNWVYDFAGRYGIDEQIRGENFQNVDGYQLCQMTAQDFVCLSESHAEFFYQDLNHLKSASPTEQGRCNLPGV